MTPVRNTFIGTVPVLKKEFIVSMDIKPTGKDRPYTNIFRMAVKGLSDCCAYGSRIPAVFFVPNSNKLHISFSVSGSGNRYFNTAELPLNKFTNLVIQQRRQYGDKYRSVFYRYADRYVQVPSCFLVKREYA